MSRDTQKGSLTYFFRNLVFIQFQKNFLFLTTCENMVAEPLLYPFLERFKIIYPKRHWYKLMTSLDDVKKFICYFVDVIGLWAWQETRRSLTALFLFHLCFLIPLQFIQEFRFALNVGLMEPMAWFARGLADQSIMQLSGTFSMKHQTAPYTHLCIYIFALFSVSPKKMVLSNEGSDVRSQL